MSSIIIFRYHSCTENSAFKPWLSAVKLFIHKNIKTIFACADMVKQITCFHRHPTCLVSASNNKTINSCERKDCYKLAKKIIKTYKFLYKLCPGKFPDPGIVINAIDCGNFPKEDIINIERCQLLCKLFLELSY